MMVKSKWIKASLAVVLGTTLLTGCASNEVQSRVSEQSVDLVNEVSDITSALIKQAVKPINKEQPILATSFASIDNLQESSTFGRLVGDSIAGRMVDSGFNIVELRLRNSLYMQPRAGEFMLSRELRHVSVEHDAQAVLVGTYAVGGEYVYVNARLVSVMDSRVLASEDFRLPLNRDIRRMLGSVR
jgi:TolB-like protein